MDVDIVFHWSKCGTQPMCFSDVFFSEVTCSTVVKQLEEVEGHKMVGFLAVLEPPTNPLEHPCHL